MAGFRGVTTFDRATLFCDISTSNGIV
jgi:hypothetical protein